MQTSHIAQQDRAGVRPARTRTRFAQVPIPVLISLALLPFVAGCEPAEVGLPPAGPNAIEVTIETDPTGSLVLVDGQRVGPAPQKVKLNPGPHTFKAMKSGYFTADQRVSVSSANRAPVVRLTLVASH